MKRIYLDHTATTPLDPRVFEAMRPHLTDVYGNASSAHWYGRQARAVLEDARGRVAAVLGVAAGEVFFTGGGTESDNLAIGGRFRSVLSRGKSRILTASAEHHAVLDSCVSWGNEGAEVVILPVDGEGRVDPERVERELTPHTALVTVMHANNEVGTIQPIEDLAEIAHREGVAVHTDAVQSAGKIPVHVPALGVDLLSISAHKFYGPKGVGVLVVRKGTEIAPLVHGGGQERGLRPGTENVALAVGCATALEFAVVERETEMERLAALRDALEAHITAAYPSAIVNGSRQNRLPHILSISFDATMLPMEGEMLVTNMDLEGIAVSSGSACTSGSIQPSHVLSAMGRDPGTAKATLRFSFGKSNSAEDLPLVVAALDRIIPQMTSSQGR